ncbi:MAG: hypothetical protein GH152_01075 [Dehalococcoidia bacterium]|nr:hypothetical protein [Dehalococcoidia bacterium]
MNVYSTIPGYRRLSSIPKLSKKAGLGWDVLEAHSRASLATASEFIDTLLE